MAQGKKLTAVKVAERNEMFASAMLAFRFNARQAGLSIGLPPASIDTAAHLLLKKPEVQELIAAKVAALVKKHDLTVDAVIAELKLIGFSNIADYTRLTEDGHRVIDFTDANREQLAAVANIKIKETVVAGRTSRGADGEDHAVLKREMTISMHDKKGALVTLLQYLTAGKVVPEGGGDTTNHFNLTQVNITPEDAIAEYRRFAREGG